MRRALVLLVILAACSGGGSASTTTTGPAEAGQSRRPWLCRPGDAGDVCGQSTDDGPQHEIDCFYLYPTVSADQTVNADLRPGAGEEVATTVDQAAPFSDVCNVYAPVYAQMTMVELLISGIDGQALDVAYRDAAQAWSDYVADDNDGRPVVLIGHSQGAAVLERLLENVVLPDPSQRQELVSALLIGWPATVNGLPLCATPDDVGCLITYSSFLADDPPHDSFFGRAQDGGGVASCTNPASLEGGRARLDSPLPGTAEAECVERNGFAYLEVTADDDFEAAVGGATADDWGLHHVDVELALGDLVGLVASQAAAWGG